MTVIIASSLVTVLCAPGDSQGNKYYQQFQKRKYYSTNYPCSGPHECCEEFKSMYALRNEKKIELYQIELI